MEDNKKELYEKMGIKTNELDIAKLFPDLNEEVMDKLKTEKEFKNDLTKWVTNNLLGTHFNHVRVCKIPDPKKGDKTKQVDYCESYKACPFYQHNAIREGKECPLEINLLNQKTNELIQGLEIENEEQIDKHILSLYLSSFLLYERASRALAAGSMDMLNIINGENFTNYEKTINNYFKMRDISLKNMEKSMAILEKHYNVRLEKGKNIIKTSFLDKKEKRLNKINEMKSVYKNKLEVIDQTSDEIIEVE